MMSKSTEYRARARAFLATLCLLVGLCAQDTVVLEGRVVDMRGQPIAVADVSVVTMIQPEVVVGVTKADGEGLFRCRVPALPPGKAWLVAATAKGLCRSQELTFSAKHPVTIVVHDAVMLHGTLLDPKGEPVANAKVFARSASFGLRGSEYVVATDAAGLFSGLRVAVGPTVVGAFVPGHGCYRADLIAAEDGEVELKPVAEPQTSIELRIKGLPAGKRPRALLRLMGSGGNPRVGLPPHMRQLQLTGDVWRVACLPDWRYLLDARSSGYSMSPATVTLKAGEGPHLVELQVTPTSKERNDVAAVVRDRDGKPVPHAEMSLVSFGANERVRARTDKGGRVTFATRLAKGSRAIIFPVGRWVIDREVRERHSGALVHDCVIDPAKAIEVRVVAAGVVEGRVLSANGQPAVFVQVELRERSGDRIASWTTVETANTDIDGRFRFSPQVARKAPVRVQVASPAGSAVGEPFLIDEPGMQATELELQLGRPSVVAGLVREADGRPAVGVIVRIAYPDRDAIDRGRADMLEVITDKQGRYRIAGVVPGKCELYVMQGHAVRAAIEVLQVQEAETKRLDLKATWLGR